MGEKKVVALSGAHGFLGTRLSEALRIAGYDVWPMVRRKTQNPHEIYYDYISRQIDSAKLAEVDAIIHLAGKNIFSGMWSTKVKQEIYDSRIESTRLIAKALTETRYRAKVFICASAIGFYGDRSNEKLTEESRKGHGFLANLCEDWERASKLAPRSLRIVNTRFGILLQPSGGMLKRLLPLFRAGLGATLGKGDQFMALVALDDAVRAIIFALENSQISGPVNVVMPIAITNSAFTATLAKSLGKKNWLRVPRAFIAMLGEQGKLAIASTRVVPLVLLEKGFKFKFEQAEDFLGSIKS